MEHFNNTTGKNIGKLQVTKLATHFEKSEGTLRSLRKRDEKEFDALHLGALCQVNGIDLESLNKIIKTNLGENDNTIEKSMSNQANLILVVESETLPDGAMNEVSFIKGKVIIAMVMQDNSEEINNILGELNLCDEDLNEIEDLAIAKLSHREKMES